jgi:ribonuclease P protein component
MRFRPEQHLRRQNDIRAVREFGARSDWRLFTLWCYHRPAQPGVGDQARTAVVASIAAVGAAVERNRAKRRLREVFRKHQQLVPQGVDMLLIARTAINKCTILDLEEKFVAAVGRIRAPKASVAPTLPEGTASVPGRSAPPS